eukprot:2907338-Pyramimonas_sp.AAC.1
MVIRNTSSDAVRDAIRRKAWPWLTVDMPRGELANWSELDAAFLRLGGDIFGGYVNPMRRRSENPDD